MNITIDQRNKFIELMNKIAKEHNLDINFKITPQNRDVLDLVISSPTTVPKEFRVVWSEAASLTEAAVTIWANMFDPRYNSNEKDVYHLDPSSIIPNYIKNDIDITKTMLNSVYGTKAFGALPSISRVIFNPPATIVFWSDKSKTVVKTHEDDEFDPEKGLAMAISKKALGNQGNYYNIFSKWVEEYEETAMIKDFIANLPTYTDDFWADVKRRLIESFKKDV